MSSFDVIRRLRRLLPGVKMGHAGTLDPMATGVLPVALGKATRLLEYLPAEPKIYRAEMILGLSSDTQDIWGAVKESGNTEYSREQLRSCLQTFQGPIRQLPPMYSALHHEGRRLYQLAREGIEVQREERQIYIYSLQLIDVSCEPQGRPLLSLEVACSAGTYVRTLCHDIGEYLGTGAVMSSLCRLRSGGFSGEQTYSLDQIQSVGAESFLISMDEALSAMPAIQLQHQDQSGDIRMGRALPAATLTASKPEEGELCRVRWQENLIAIGRWAKQKDGRFSLQPVKVLV